MAKNSYQKKPKFSEIVGTKVVQFLCYTKLVKTKNVPLDWYSSTKIFLSKAFLWSVQSYLQSEMFLSNSVDVMKYLQLNNSTWGIHLWLKPRSVREARRSNLLRSLSPVLNNNDATHPSLRPLFQEKFNSMPPPSLESIHNQKIRWN